jgi:hypothetical protein
MASVSQAAEIFSAPIEGVIAALGRGIAEAQRELDRSSLEAQKQIDSDPELSQIGAQATWFQLPKVDLELKLALTMSSQPKGTTSGRIAAIQPLRLVAQPVSAAFQNHFNYDVQGSSLVRVTVVPVPPPHAGDRTTAPPRLDDSEVENLALASKAGFATVSRAGEAVPNPKLRLDVNYNPASRSWYVLQYDPADPQHTAVAVAVDDATGVVRVVGD